MRIQKKYPSKMRSYSSIQRPSSQNSNKVQASANFTDALPRPNIRKDGTRTSQEVSVKAEIEVNPQSPLLAPPVQENKAEVETQELENIKTLRIEKTNKSKKLIEKNEESSERDYSENSSLQDEVFANESFSKLSKESSEKLDALKKSLLDSEESKNSYFVVKDANNKQNTIYSEEERLLREERLAVATQRNYTHSSAWQWTLTLRPASVLTGISVLCITLGFFFVFGLIVGRGLNPASEPIDLVSIVPNEQESLLTEEAPILEAEELEYASVLKKSDNTTSSNSDSTESAEENQVQPYPIGEEALASGQAQVEGQVLSPQEAQLQIFDYVLRVASLKNTKDAEALKARLESNGIRASVARSGSWYLVNVHFLGQEDSFEEMRAGLSKFGIKDSIVTDKVALKLD